MPKELVALDIRQRHQWRAWLQRHHASSPGVWLTFHTKAWRSFQELTPSQRRLFVVWIHTAVRPETREKRIRESLALLAARRKLGLK